VWNGIQIKHLIKEKEEKKRIISFIYICKSNTRDLKQWKKKQKEVGKRTIKKKK